MDSKNNNFDISFLRKFAKLLDSQFKIPGTKYTFGIDPLIGLIPEIGSFSGLITGFIFVVIVVLKGGTLNLILKMTVNILIDFFLGLIPILGQFTDFVFKANEKNILLVEEHFIDGKHSSNSKWFLLMIFIFLLLLFCICLAILFAIFSFFKYLLD